MNRGLVVAAALIWSGVVSAESYELTEVPPRRSVGSWPSAVAIGDISGDGLDDVVVGTGRYEDIENDFHLFVFFQQADGSLGDPLKFKYAEFSSSSVDIEIGDFDNNGIMDVVAGHSGTLTLLLADGVSGFRQSAIRTPVEGSASYVKLLDVDANGNLDILAQYDFHGPSVFFGNGRGGIAGIRMLPNVAGGLDDLATGDLTGDGWPDLVVASGRQFHVHPHNGVDGFQVGVPYAAPVDYLRFSTGAIGDLNGDGWNDIAAAITGHGPDAGVWLYLGSSTGVSEAPRRLPTLDRPEALKSADLDHDGLTDLLVGHSGQGAVGRYMQGEDGLGSELSTNTAFNGGSRALAVGDVNDDGCTDAAIVDYPDGLILLHGSNCAPVRAVNDFNGDGRSDLFWHHSGTGANVIWRGGDYREQQPVVRVTNPSWQVKGHGDFDGDGRADVLWRNVATGAGAIWRSGDFTTQQPVTRVTNLDWTIVGIGDFSGDGKDDLLWRNRRTGQNAIWRSGNYRDQQAIIAVTDPRWTVVAVDDFNGDRKDDILWRHAVSGGNAIWRSGNFRNQQPVTGVRNQAWQVAGTGDFNGDDRAEILWRNERSGTNAIWNAANIDDQSLVREMGLEWVVAAVGDHDGNRNAEIVWRNRVTGENRIWRAMNATLERPVTDVANPAWQVAP